MNYIYVTMSMKDPQAFLSKQIQEQSIFIWVFGTAAVIDALGNLYCDYFEK